jgi:hypothetical protein
MRNYFITPLTSKDKRTYFSYHQKSAIRVCLWRSDGRTGVSAMQQVNASILFTERDVSGEADMPVH